MTASFISFDIWYTKSLHFFLLQEYFGLFDPCIAICILESVCQIPQNKTNKNTVGILTGITLRL